MSMVYSTGRQSEDVWKGATFKDLLNSMRGQQLAITILLQLLHMCFERLRVYSMPDSLADRRRDSLSEIKQLLQRQVPHLPKAAKSIRSLRQSYPPAHVAKSSYNETDLVSVYLGPVPRKACSEWKSFDDELRKRRVWLSIDGSESSHDSTVGVP
jgi:hypothetical protein